MKRDYVDEPLYEIMFEMQDGELYYLYGKFAPHKVGKSIVLGEAIPLYTASECDRIGMKYEDVPWIDLPFGDFTAEYEGGLVTIKKGDLAVLMFYRTQLKRCVTNLPVDIRERLG